MKWCLSSLIYTYSFGKLLTLIILLQFEQFGPMIIFIDFLIVKLY